MENYFEQGLHALEDGHYAAAVEAFTRAYRLSLGDLAEVLHYRGVAFACLGDYNRAVEDFDEALALNPVSVDTCYERGNVLAAQGNGPAALRDYNTTLALEPDHEAALYRRALLYAATGAAAAAETDLTQALALNAGLIPAYELRGRLRAARYDYAGAISDLEQYLRRGGGRTYDNHSDVQSLLITLRFTRFVLRLLRLTR
jgi:tetratricopeptide (TPR) repeat protein